MALTHTAQEMSNNLEYGSNQGGQLGGRIDAVAHVGFLVSGQWDEEFLSDVQATNLNPEDSDPEYVKGYEEGWNATFNLIYGVRTDKLHAEFGDVTTKKA